MLNAWDIAFVFLALLGLWIGWKLKSLPLLGLGFAFALAPLAALKWQDKMADFLVRNLGGKGLDGQQSAVAYWLIFCVAAAIVFLLFKGLSNILKGMQMEGLDRTLGAFMVLVILLACLKLNLKSWSQRVDPGAKSKLSASYTWIHLKPEGAEPNWANEVKQTLPDLSKIGPKTVDHSRKKAAHR